MASQSILQVDSTDICLSSDAWKRRLSSNSFLVNYDFAADRDLEDGIFIKLKSLCDTSVLAFCVCYLPPEQSSRHTEVDSFFSDLMEKVYEYQNDGHLTVCGDFNGWTGIRLYRLYIGRGRCKPREVLDDTIYRYDDRFLDFLINYNFCMLNERLGTIDFTTYL